MRVLIAAPYLYKPDWIEFSRNKTGFGIMLYDIVDFVSKIVEVQFVSNIITEGHKTIIARHKWHDVFKNLWLKDIKRGVSLFFKYPQNFKERAKCVYFSFNKGFIRKIIKEYKPDIVHIHGIGQTTLPYIEVCEEMNIAYIVTLHGLIGLDDSVKVPVWDKELEKEFLIKADQKSIPVTVISTGMKRRIEEKYLKHMAQNIYVVCNGTRIPIVDKVINVESINLRKLYKIKDGEKIIVVIGTLCERKNQIQIIRSLALKKLTTPCRVFLCGTDSTNGAIQKEIQKLGLDRTIHLMGFVPQFKITQILEQADLNIVASQDEGFGLSIIEAYNHGVPTVMFSDLDAFTDLYSPETIERVDKRDDNALAEAIEKALQKKWNKSLIKRFGKQFSLERMSKRYLMEYKKTIVRKGANENS